MRIQVAAIAVTVALAYDAQAQTTVKRIYAKSSPLASQRFASAIWAGDTLYIAGQMADPAAPANAAKGTAAVYGDTDTQAMSVLAKIQNILKTQGLTMGDIVQMDCFVAGDSTKGGKMDFAGLNTAYGRFFGTPEQPNKPVRAAMQVAGLATDWGLVEIQVVAVRSHSATQEIVELRAPQK